MMLFRLLPLLVITLVLSACSNLTVSGGYLSDKKLEAVKRYAVDAESAVSAGSAQYNIVFLDELLRKNLQLVLAERNIKLVEEADAQMLVLFFFELEHKTGVEKTLGKLGADPYQKSTGEISDANALMPGLDSPRLTEYAYGDLLVKITEVGNNEPVWQGKAGLAIADIPEYGEIDKQFQQVLHKMFSRFP